jgi:hypothetical protein
MFFRNTGGIVFSSSSAGVPSSEDRAGQPQFVQAPHVRVMQTQNASGTIPDEPLDLEKDITFPTKDNELNTFWTGIDQVPSLQDGLDWFFEPMDGNSDRVNSPLPPQFEPDVPVQIQLPTLHDSDGRSRGKIADEEEVNIFVEMNACTHQDNDWAFARSNMLDSVSQLDMQVLQSPFFEIDNLKMFLGLYFKHYHPHFPIVHQATFSVLACHPLLLIAILDLGSAMAVDEMLFHMGQQVHSVLRLTILNVRQRFKFSLYCVLQLTLHRAGFLSRRSLSGAFKPSFWCKLMGR